LHHAHQALDAAQAESSAAASEALHNALEGMRDEADEVQVCVRACVCVSVQDVRQY